MPEKVHGTLLAIEASGVLLEDLVHPRQHVVVTPHIGSVADAVVGVLIQRLLIVEIKRSSVYGDFYPQRFESPHEMAVEIRDGQVVQREPELSLLASGDF